jgi:two-component system NtrC family response regulator
MDDINTFSQATGERVLIVEDDPATRSGLAELVQNWGFQTDEAADGEEALRRVTSFRPAIIVSDLVMPRMGGHDLLKTLKDQLSDLTFILLTAQGTVESAVEAIKDGAYDYLSKPVDPQRLKILLQKSVERQETLREVRNLRRQLREQGSFGRIVGNSPGIRSVYRVIEQAAPTAASVLIWGESGTGKELIAQTIHELSPRATFPFVAMNCAAIPETLLESELFGYEKGAFTGAVKQTIGKLETANEGTLFLDEIGDLPLALQAKLLRFLQERVIERIGGRQEIPVDVRIVCATHQSLKAQISEGRFREDLYYRLAEIIVEIPPLRARQGDAALLAHGFVRRFADEQRRGAMTLHPDAIAAIEAYPWPGNVRELENVIKRAVIMADGNEIGAIDIGLGAANEDFIALNLRQVREQAERNAVLRVLGRVNGNLSRAAELLGVSRPTLYDLMHRFGLK